MTRDDLIRLSCLGLILSGCLWKDGSPPTEFFVLEPRVDEAGPPLTASHPLALGSVTLPPELDRPELVRRSRPGRVEVLGGQRWAGPLDDLVYHALGVNLAARLSNVVLAGQPKPNEPLRTLDVIIEKFSGGAEGSLVLRARWVVTASDGEALLTRTADIRVPLSSPSEDALALAMSQSLAELAERVAHAVAELDG